MWSPKISVENRKRKGKRRKKKDESRSPRTDEIVVVVHLGVGAVAKVVED